MRTFLRLATVLTVFLGVSFVQLPMSQAVEVPETLAHQRPVGVGPVVPEFPIDYLGVLWETQGAPDEHADEEAEEHGAVRFRVDGTWTAWHPLTEDGAHAEGQWASALVPAGDAEEYQVRGVPADAVAPRAVALNTTDGPLVEVGRRPAGGANAIDNCFSRSEWGADEDLRFDDSGTEERWPTEFHPVQTMTVHHTATKNDDTDPAATVRAIYRYHAVDRDWGDIGYHYLIDQYGGVYEGRWSGVEPRTGSEPCSTGDGSDFAHDESDGLVTAGHTGGYNSGNMGAALLGNFTTSRRDGAEPAAPAVDALESLLAEFATRHGLDPHAEVTYTNPVTGDLKKVDMISGHRDWTSTECPGERLYDDLPAIRDAVAAQMAALSVSVTSPAEGDVVEGTVPVTAAASDGVTSVDFLVDGTKVYTDASSDGGWSFLWDTSKAKEGGHTLTVAATKGSSTASSTISVTVNNDDDPVVTIGTPSEGAVVEGSLTVSGTAQDVEGLQQVEVFVDDTPLNLAGTLSEWSAGWDTATVSEGEHRLTATVTDSVGQKVSHSITVTVDNVISVESVTPNSGNQNTTVQVTISGSGFRDEPTVELQNGEGTKPGVSGVTFVDADTVMATFSIGKTSGARKDRPWDVVVKNPDGTSALLPDGFTVLR